MQEKIADIARRDREGRAQTHRAFARRSPVPESDSRAAAGEVPTRGSRDDPSQSIRPGCPGGVADRALTVSS